MKRKSIFSGILVAVIAVAVFVLTRKTEDDGYTDDLSPLKSETDRLGSYESAVHIILENLEEILEERSARKAMIEKTQDYGASLPASPGTDNITYIQNNELKLRFICDLQYDLKVQERDTVIVFKAESSDYNMTGNRDRTYTLYRHSIIYSSAPIKEREFTGMDGTPCKTIRLKDKFYYEITSHLEF